MNDPEYLDPIIGIPLALIFWAIFLYKPVKNKINDFFAKRRQIRRDRNTKNFLRAVN